MTRERKALEQAFALLQAQYPTGALAQLPAGGIECERLVEEALQRIRDGLGVAHGSPESYAIIDAHYGLVEAAHEGLRRELEAV